jgi:hypothetical protein
MRLAAQSKAQHGDAREAEPIAVQVKIDDEEAGLDDQEKLQMGRLAGTGSLPYETRARRLVQGQVAVPVSR